MRVAHLAAVSYAAVGLVTAILARAAPSPQLRTVWRLTAWVLSLGIFVAQIAYESARGRYPVRHVATHAAVAVGLGAFALAAIGPVRSHWGSTDLWRVSLLSLVLWPVLTGIPAFLAALAAATIVRRFARGRSASSTR